MDGELCFLRTRPKQATRGTPLLDGFQSVNRASVHSPWFLSAWKTTLFKKLLDVFGRAPSLRRPLGFSVRRIAHQCGFRKNNAKGEKIRITLLRAPQGAECSSAPCFCT